MVLAPGGPDVRKIQRVPFSGARRMAETSRSVLQYYCLNVDAFEVERQDGDALAAG